MSDVRSLLDVVEWKPCRLGVRRNVLGEFHCLE